MEEAFRLHRHLIGRQGSRGQLNTPVLVLELAALEANIAAMAGFARRAGIALRPHSKTHKSPEIARRQIAAGAAGICCAKLGEAEAMVEAGIAGVLLTSPVVTPMGIERLVALNARAEGLVVVADDPDNVEALAAAARQSGRPLAVVIDIDPGIHRTGVASPEAALALARRVADAPALRYAGLQFYSGRLQHVGAYADRRAAAIREADYLRDIVARLAREGLPPPLVTGGGTGTHEIDAELGVLTEIQAGSYVFLDVQYEAVALRADGSQPFVPALFVDTTVVSANTPGLATTDAGLKAFATDGPAPRLVDGAPAGSAYRFFGDEHGAITLPQGRRLAPGSLVTCLTPHCDPTVNLHDAYYVVQGRTLTDIWPIAARGRSR